MNGKIKQVKLLEKRFNLSENLLNDITQLFKDKHITKGMILWVGKLFHKEIFPDFTELRLIADWQRALTSQLNGIQFNYDLTLEEAKTLAEEYHLQQYKILDIEGKESHKIIELSNGWYWTKLKNREDCLLEGNLMGNCIRNYSQQVLKEKLHIYSLRDNNNKPHVSIGMDGNSIVEFKGKQNLAAETRYLKMAIPILKYTHEVYWKKILDSYFWTNVDSYVAKELHKLMPNHFSIEQRLKFEIPIKQKIIYHSVLLLNVKDDIKIPDGLTIKGNCTLSGEISSLPNNFTVHGYLDISASKIKKISKNLYVGSSLYVAKDMLNIEKQLSNNRGTVKGSIMYSSNSTLMNSTKN